MREFVHFIKLYGFPDRDHVSLSFRESSRFVQTFHITGEIFRQIMRDYETSAGCNHPPFFVHAKGDYVRFSHSANSFETNWRIPTADWKSLLRDYEAQLANGDGRLITCLID